jgi:hypothetical protein
MSCLALLSAILISFLFLLGPVVAPINSAVAPNPLVVQQVVVPTNSPTTEPDTTFALGDIVTTNRLDRNGCPTIITATFDEDEIVYIVAEDSQVAEGTWIFMRFYYNDQIYEESEVIVADQDYENTCIAFTLEPDSVDALQRGDYIAEFIVNGNTVGQTGFTIQ